MTIFLSWIFLYFSDIGNQGYEEGRQIWLGHVERKESWVERSMCMYVVGKVSRGRPTVDGLGILSSR